MNHKGVLSRTYAARNQRYSRIHSCGHDFAVVDGRFIVDPWPRLVPAVFEKMVFDLEDPEDAALALDVYGPRNC